MDRNGFPISTSLSQVHGRRDCLLIFLSLLFWEVVSVHGFGWWTSHLFREAVFFPARKVGFCLCSKQGYVVVVWFFSYVSSAKLALRLLECFSSVLFWDTGLRCSHICLILFEVNMVHRKKGAGPWIHGGRFWGILRRIASFLVHSILCGFGFAFLGYLINRL